MCRIEYFYVIFPDGTRERRERRLHCNRGTRHSLCTDIEYIDNFDERRATQSEVEEQTGPVYRVIAPRGRQTEEHETHNAQRQGRPRRTGDRRDSLDGLAVELKGWKLFRYFLKTKKSRTPKSEFVLIREKEKDNSRPSSRRTPTPERRRQHSPSPGPRSRSPYSELQSHPRRSSREPRIVHVEPKAVKEAETGGRKSQGRKSPPKPVQIHQTDRRKSSTSPSTPISGREHSRPTSAMFSATGTSKYEAEKEKQRQKELKEHERRRYEQQKHAEAEMVAEAKRAIAQAKAKTEEDRKRKERKVAEEESSARRRARILEQEEKEAEAERRRLAEEDRRRAEAEERHRKPRKRFANPREGETDAQMRARIRQHEEDIRKIREADRRKEERETQDHDRLGREGTRQHHRHANMIHNPSSDDDYIEEDEDEDLSYDPDDLDARGDHFIESAIRDEEQHEAERRARADEWRQPFRTAEGVMRETWDGRQVEEYNGGGRRRKRKDRR